MPSRPILPCRVGFAALLVLAACSSSGSSPATTSTTSTSAPVSTVVVEDHQLVLGAVLPRGGAASDIGVSMRAAIELAVSEINGSGGVLGNPVRLITSDEGDNPSSALLAVQGLIQSNVDAIIGPTSSLNVLNTLATSVQAGVLTCSPTASALALDDFPDNGLFLRTVPSDSLQAVAIAGAVEDSGSNSAAVVYLDDDYGRPFAKATERALRAHNTTVLPSVAFSATEESIAGAVRSVTALHPSIVVVIGSGSSGPAIIRAIDAASPIGTKPSYIVNDAIRRPDASVPPFDKDLGARVRGVSPLAYSSSNVFTAALKVQDPGATGLYAANAYDCVNLIALAAQSSGATLGATMSLALPGVSTGGSSCASFPECNAVLQDGRNPDYNGPNGEIAIGDNGDPFTAVFERFTFDANGHDVALSRRTVSSG